MILLEEKLYTSEETASILGISLRTLYRYLKKGEIEAETKTQSGTFRFTRKQIYKYLYPDKFNEILQKLKETEPSSGKKILYYDDLSEIQSADFLTKQTPTVPDSDELIASKILPDKVKGSTNTTTEDGGASDENSMDNTISSKNHISDVSSIDNKVVEESVVSMPFTQEEVAKIKEERQNKGLDSELQDLVSLLDQTKKNISSSNNLAPTPDPVNNTPITPVKIPSSTQNNSDVVLKDISNLSKKNDDSVVGFNFLQGEGNSSLKTDSVAVDNNSLPQGNLGDNLTYNPDKRTVQGALTNNEEPPSPQVLNVQHLVTDEKWLYFINTDKDILELAREINAISRETGRKYAATMKGGLSLHHDIDEFNIVHFYVPKDDFNWYVNELSLKPSDESQANICLIPTTNNEIFDNSYNLRGLYVVSDSRLIQDLMSHNEKDLAKTLL